MNTKAAFEHIFKKYAPNLVLFAITYVKEKSIAEELVQDTFLTMWEKRDELAFNDKLRSYLYTSVKNRCFNHLSKKRLKFQDKEDIVYETKGDYPNPIESLTKKETEAKIQEGIGLLPDKCKRVFLLSRNEQMTYKEIANFQEVSVKTVENQMGFALKFLREHLGVKKDKTGKGFYLPSITFLLA